MIDWSGSLSDTASLLVCLCFGPDGDSRKVVRLDCLWLGLEWVCFDSLLTTLYAFIAFLLIFLPMLHLKSLAWMGAWSVEGLSLVVLAYALLLSVVYCIV